MDSRTRNELDELLSPYFIPDFWNRLQGRLIYRASEHAVPPEQLEALLQTLLARGYIPHVDRTDGEIVLYVAGKVPRRKPKYWLHALLFLATIFTTMAAGASLVGKDILLGLNNIWYGWQYSMAVLLILTSHEMGHYIAARLHKVDVTLPYYIPLYLPALNFGTMGAFIKIRSPIPNRRALMDIGVAGPIAGFIVSLIMLIYGYATLPDLDGIIAYVEKIHPWNPQGVTVNVVLGKSLLFAFFNDVIGGGRLPMNEVYHFPFIFAGWIGLLVTAINLIPIGQLDGGHILYALIGNKSRRAGITAFIILLVLNIFLWYRYATPAWMLWIIFILVLIGFRHPPTLNDTVALSPLQRILGWTSMVIFILCFIPLPIYVQ